MAQHSPPHIGEGDRCGKGAVFGYSGYRSVTVRNTHGWKVPGRQVRVCEGEKKKPRRQIAGAFEARLGGFEPPAFGTGIQRSIQLSYKRVGLKYIDKNHSGQVA